MPYYITNDRVAWRINHVVADLFNNNVYVFYVDGWSIQKGNYDFPEWFEGEFGELRRRYDKAGEPVTSKARR